MELATVGHASSNTQTLAQRASGHINEGQSWGWMSLKVRVNLSQIHQLLHREETCLSPGSIEDGSSMTLGQNEPEINQ